MKGQQYTPVNYVSTLNMKKPSLELREGFLERMTGFEPATPDLEGRCSDQLSYIRKVLNFLFRLCLDGKPTKANPER